MQMRASALNSNLRILFILYHARTDFTMGIPRHIAPVFTNHNANSRAFVLIWGTYLTFHLAAIHRRPNGRRAMADGAGMARHWQTE